MAVNVEVFDMKKHAIRFVCGLLYIAVMIIALSLILGPAILAIQTNNEYWGLFYIPIGLLAIYRIGANLES
jgi:hypothetical protein